MNYEKKYDEALERARKLKENPQSVFNEYSPKKGDTICDYIFPELCESKDERIRKELIEFVKSRGGFKQEYIAWLEKQGEQKVNYTTLAETGNGGINALVTRELSTNGYSEQKSANEVEPKFKKD